ncbi:MAG: Iron complex outerrane recepter protein [Verrucomicrobia bacterium]|nr:Iron complex outerrane recepter protein [Verrucomicrobiota bacterium]
MKTFQIIKQAVSLAVAMTAVGAFGGEASTYPVPYSHDEKMSSFKPNGYILAQKLVDQLPRRFPEVEYGLMHAPLPDGSERVVIASHRPEQVGEIDMAVDIAVAREECIYIIPRKRQNYASTVIMLPAKDASGKFIQAVWSIYFYSDRHDSVPKILERAMAVRDEMAKQIPGLDALFQPVKRDPPSFRVPGTD